MLGRNKGQGGGERTAADRAAAAAERARRRGEAPPPMAEWEEEQAAPAPPAPEEPAPAAEPWQEPAGEAAVHHLADPEPWQEPADPADPAEPTWHEPPAAEPVTEPPAEIPPAQPPEPAWHEEAAAPAESVSWFEDQPAEPPATELHEPEPEPEPEPDPEPLPPADPRAPRPAPQAPLPGRRAAPSSPRSGGRRPAPARPPARGGRGRPTRAPGGRELPPGMRPPSRTGRRVLALAVLLVLLAGAWAAVRTFQPFHGDPTGLVRVKIPPGADAGRIGDLLEERGVVSSGRFFSVNATVTGRRGQLVAGTYTLQRDMAYGAVLDALAKGPKAVKLKTFKLTVPEGLSIAETADRVGDDLDGSYAKAATSAEARGRARALGLPAKARTTEGFLFPATYDLVNGASATDLVDKQLDAYAANVKGVSYRRAKARKLTRYDVLIIASMIERETRLDKERPLVAAVIYNRLKQGMPLGIDATIRYAERNWSKPLKQSELTRPGPYNTRLNRGLPPTPIGNPGLASIKAAAAPAKAGYLYYVVKPGTEGHAFSRTEAQFNRDVERYNAARAGNGGNAP